jgi:universal stress protein E
MEIPKILVLIADPHHEDQPALARATALCADFGAELHLHTIVYNTQLADGIIKDDDERARLIKMLVEKRLDALQALSEPLCAQGLQYSYSAAWDYPIHESLARTAAGYDLVVSDTFGRVVKTPPIRVLSQTDWQLIANCPTPCLIVRTSGLNPYRQVLAAVDPNHSKEGTAALDGALVEAAKLMSSTFGAGLRVLHAYQSLGETVGFPVEPTHPIAKDLAADMENRMGDFVKQHGLDPGTVCIYMGSPDEAILKTVKELFVDLLVMGAVARGRIHDWVIGSTAEHVIGDLDCDLLAIKPAGFRARLGKPVKQHLLLGGSSLASNK